MIIIIDTLFVLVGQIGVKIADFGFWRIKADNQTMKVCK